MRQTVLAFLILFNVVALAANDTLNVKEEIRVLNNKIDEINRNQLNYKIENDLLEKTYSKDYDLINLMLTVIIGFFGILTFLGFRNANALKKEYKEELENLKKIKIDLETKSKEFETSKIKYDQEIKDIITQNEEQNRKIKILELKEKINKLFNDTHYSNAYDYCIVALEIAPNDPQLLYSKARIQSKMGNFQDAIVSYEKLLEVEPQYTVAIGDLAELYFFYNQEKKASILIENNNEFFKTKLDGKLTALLNLWKAYHAKDITKIDDFSISEIDKKDLKTKKKKYEGWDLSDAILYLSKEPDSECKKHMLYLFTYLTGKISGEDLIKFANLTLESE